ncbi:MAG: hypothetical protein EBU82_14200, partial [Flavobacteriia bacterium]|nr:hypothetical protein [Flavobacteriia bacterium]
MNLKHLMLVSCVLLGVLACSQPSPNTKITKVPQMKEDKIFELNDFLGSDQSLDQAVEEVFKQLDDTAIVAQLVMPAVGKYGQTTETIEQHIKQRIIGGVLMLNGTQNEFTQWIAKFNA